MLLADTFALMPAVARSVDAESACAARQANLRLIQRHWADSM